MHDPYDDPHGDVMFPLPLVMPGMARKALIVALAFGLVALILLAACVRQAVAS